MVEIPDLLLTSYISVDKQPVNYFDLEGFHIESSKHLSSIKYVFGIRWPLEAAKFLEHSFNLDKSITFDDICEYEQLRLALITLLHICQQYQEGAIDWSSILLHLSATHRFLVISILREHFLTTLKPLSIPITETNIITLPYLVCLQLLCSSSSDHPIIQSILENEIITLLMLSSSSMGVIEYHLWSSKLFMEIRSWISVFSIIRNCLISLESITYSIQSLKHSFLISRLRRWLSNYPIESSQHLAATLYQWLSQLSIEWLLLPVSSNTTTTITLADDNHSIPPIGILYISIRLILPCNSSQHEAFRGWLSSCLEFIDVVRFRTRFLSILRLPLEMERLDWELLDIERHLLSDKTSVPEVMYHVDLLIGRLEEVKTLQEFLDPSSKPTPLLPTSNEKREILSLIHYHRETDDLPVYVYQWLQIRPLWFSRIFLPELQRRHFSSDVNSRLYEMLLNLEKTTYQKPSLSSLDPISHYPDSVKSVGFPSITSIPDIGTNNSTMTAITAPPNPRATNNGDSDGSSPLITCQIICKYFDSLLDTCSVKKESDYHDDSLLDTILYVYHKCCSNNSSSLNRQMKIQLFQKLHQSFQFYYISNLMNFPMMWQPVLQRLFEILSNSTSHVSDPLLRHVALATILEPLSLMDLPSPYHLLSSLWTDLLLRALFTCFSTSIFTITHPPYTIPAISSSLPSSLPFQHHVYMLGHWSAYLNRSAFKRLQSLLDYHIFSNPSLSKFLMCPDSIISRLLYSFLEGCIETSRERVLLTYIPHTCGNWK